MILGIGSDIIDLTRLEKTVARFGERFLDRIYTPIERAKADRRKDMPHAYIGTLGKRYAAKEAVSKALGTGFNHGVAWRTIGVVNDPSGRPTLHLTGGAAVRLAAMVPAGYVARLDLTMTDEWPYAEAMVIISALPTPALPTPALPTPALPTPALPS